MNKIVLFVATLGPIGTKLPAPGTMGSLAGTIVFAFLTLVLGFPVLGIALFFIPLFIDEEWLEIWLIEKGNELGLTIK